ncbi:DUF4402 domain-containing protein [Fuchsiella alkaliacetigena]|uniref:DUF4402 domain-containing protein n=1 Tax=Fuchsiella alkaliacetigena TaxID=957042 RepID=UPI00200A9189|nr:DUF4402 domain-containing protein [Fuchsiella alkaliacetigena]MCK8824764.1 DUF4402 domain-containing protein [Fuchsiella alkaliacetigena]
MWDKRVSIVLFIICLLLYSGALMAQGPGLQIRNIQDSLYGGEVFTGVEEVIISPDSSEALEVEVSRGEPGGEFEVSFPDDEVELEGDRNGFVIMATDFTTNLEDNKGYFDENGEAIFTIGATFKEIAEGIAGGDYEGSAFVEVNSLD